MHGVIAIPV